jgi:hypothetical protein
MAQRGRKKLGADEIRSEKVEVHLSAPELAALDTARGPRGRAEHVRMCIRNAVPSPIPAINTQTASDLGRALGNLSALAAASRRGGFVPERDLLPVLIDLRNLLLVGKTQLLHGDEE